MTTLLPSYLRAHSYYGFLESLLSPRALVDLAVQYHVPALGLTDHRYLSGAIEFYEACKSAGIKPILGLEIDFVYHGFSGLITLFAKNQAGWANLSRLSSHLLIQNTHVDITLLESHQDGLVAVMGDNRGILREVLLSSPPSQNLPGRLVEDIKRLFPENCFLEIQRYVNGPLKNETLLLDLARSRHLPLLAAQNIFYATPSEESRYRTLTAIRHISAIQSLSPQQLPPGSAYFPAPKDFAYRFQDLPEALENLDALVESIDLELPIGKTHFPEFPTPNGETQADYLRKSAYAGAKRIYQSVTPEIKTRLDYELEIITGMGYEPIFLIVEDILNNARKLGIPTSSRGSAASSLVAHCLNITSPDPLALNLYFERFLNPARKKPPDIDTDIDSSRRDEVIRYVFNAYGTDRVAMVATVNRYRPKSALGDVAKAYGLSPETIRQLSKRLPSSFRFRRESSVDEDPFRSLLQENSIPILKNILNDARALLDMPRHLSVHPGGIVIAPFPITDLVPLVHSDTLGINHTQYDLEGIEKLGLVKIDLLGIRGLTVLGEVAERIRSWHLSEYKDGLEVLSKIPAEDEATTQTVFSARTIGCFQIESPGMRSTLREIQAKSIKDIMAALALYRPGPLRGGLRDAFVRRFRGEEEVTDIHGSLSNLLSETLGVILYQEQVLRIAHELGGLSLAEADILRRAMSHFDPGGVMITLQRKFVQNAQERKNVPPETAERIWEMMAAFAGYGFPKAHAASYARLAWNSAWCKTHYPAEFMAAVLGFGGGYYSQRVYLMEARRLGLSLHGPHINHSNHRFRVAYPKGQPRLYMGLNQVRDLTQRTISTILQKKPFTSLEDFLIRVDPQRKEAQHLLMCGALEGLISIPQGLTRIEHKRPSGQMQLFNATGDVDDWSPEQKFEAQRRILGVSLDSTPLELMADRIHSVGAITTLEAESRVGETVVVAGMRQTWRRTRTRSNQMMAYLNLEDMEGSLQVLVPPRLYQRCNQDLQEAGPFLIRGTVEMDAERQQVRLVAAEISLLS